MQVSSCWGSVLSFFSAVDKCLIAGCSGFYRRQLSTLVCCCHRVGKVLVVHVRASQPLRLPSLAPGCNWSIGRLLTEV